MIGAPAGGVEASLTTWFRVQFYESLVPQYVVDRCGRVELVNDAFCALTGLDRAALHGRPLRELVHTSDPGVGQPELERVVRGELGACRTEQLLRSAYGRAIPVVVFAAAVSDADGGVQAVSVTVADLSDLREVDRRLQRRPAAVPRPRLPRPDRTVAGLRAEHGLDRILDLRADGASPATIAAALNNEGYRTPAGLRWHRRTVTRVLDAVPPGAVSRP